MKRMLVLLVAVAAAACGDNPTGADATRFELVEYFGDPVPVNMTLETPGEPPPVCNDTLLGGYIELATGSSAARQSFRYVRNCGGVRMLSANDRSGTYAMHADTVRLTWNIDTQPIGQLSEYAILAGEQLRIPYTVYSEAEPDGTEISIIYRR